jgi:hypothetical protein
MAVNWPDYGDDRFILRKRGKGFKLVREVFTDAGFSTQYDEEAKDFSTHKGSWKDVETLGTFDTAEEARQFMIARANALTAGQDQGGPDA